MDAIAGREDTNRLTGEAQQVALSILRLHEQAAAKYNEFTQLEQTVQHQRAMREGLQQLKDANLISLRDQMAQALADNQELARLAEHLESLPFVVPERAAAVLQTAQFRFEESSPLSDVTARASSALAELTELAAGFGTEATDLARRKAVALGDLRLAAANQFEEFARNYQERLSQFAPEIQRLLESHRDVLEKTRDLPTLEARLASLCADIEASLADLAVVAEDVAALLDARTELRQRKIQEFNAQLTDAGVRLEVVPGAASEDEYSTTLNQYGPARETFNMLRSAQGTAKRFHRILARSYNNLRADLAAGERVLFSRAEFGRLITILENDDLTIRFAVGKLGEEFSPIDQLSAGQRCTAVFPILLKLRDGPLIVDQPEDNLDNRHIAKSVAVVLAVDKRTRQIVMTSHNANLVVLSDPESIIAFEAEMGHGFIGCAGFLSHRGSCITSHVLDILDGGERALELRTKKYGKHVDR